MNGPCGCPKALGAEDFNKGTSYKALHIIALLPLKLSMSEIIFFSGSSLFLIY